MRSHRLLCQIQLPFLSRGQPKNTLSITTLLSSRLADKDLRLVQRHGLYVALLLTALEVVGLLLGIDALDGLEITNTHRMHATRPIEANPKTVDTTRSRFHYHPHLSIEARVLDEPMRPNKLSRKKRQRFIIWFSPSSLTQPVLFARVNTSSFIRISTPRSQCMGTQMMLNAVI